MRHVGFVPKLTRTNLLVRFFLSPSLNIIMHREGKAHKRCREKPVFAKTAANGKAQQQQPMEEMTPLCLARKRLKRPRPPTQLRQQGANDLIFSSHQWQTRNLPVSRAPPAANAQRSHGEERMGDAASAVGADNIPAAVGASSSCSSYCCCRCRCGGADARAARSHTFSSRGAVRPRRRRRAATATQALAVTAVALTLVRAGSSAAPTQQQQHRQARSSTTALSSRLCSPSEDSRAYVTTIADNDGGGGSSGRAKSGDRLLGARVLAQSLRSAGARGEVVVLVPRDRADAATVDSLRRDGLTVQVVPRGLQSGEKSLAASYAPVMPHVHT